MSSLADALSTLSDRGLRRLLGARTFLRGLDYEKRKVVESVGVNDSVAQGRVKGSDPEPYEVTIRLGGTTFLYQTLAQYLHERLQLSSKFVPFR